MDGRLDKGSRLERNSGRIEDFFDDDGKGLDIWECGHSDIRRTSGPEIIEIPLGEDIDLRCGRLGFRHAVPNDRPFRLIFLAFFFGLFLVGFVLRRIGNPVPDHDKLFILDLIRVLWDDLILLGQLG